MAEQISYGLCYHVFVIKNSPENRDFDVLFQKMTVKKSPVVCMFTCRYFVSIFTIIVFAVLVDVAVLES